jgi:chromosomal replication initiator protein
MSSLSDVVWADILHYVRAHYPSLARGWFGQLQPDELESGHLVILAASPAQLQYLRQYAVHPFVEAAQSATGRLVSVAFECRADAPAPSAAPRSTASTIQEITSPLRLNADYVFDNFVVGPCNRLAHAACIAISQSPGEAYNPLFVYGSVGLGKTHLVQAVCHALLDQNPAARLMYLSCETFVNHFIEAVENGALHDFRYAYRHVDMLVIDDVQFLANRDRTQEEFFHTFNTLYQLRKQIILSSDCSPSQLSGIEERLVSRFKWGLVARIDAPGLETRMAIIRKKMKLRGMDLPEDVVHLIASRLKSNTRELEGALARLYGMAALEDSGPIAIDLARRALNLDETDHPRQVRVQDIMSVVTERFAVKLSDLRGRRRSRSVALPRQVCMYLARQLTNHSLGEIGGFFGGRDHTTVLHAHKLIGQRCQTDTELRSRVEEIKAALQQN